ncbi:cAMP-binding domain of CRP or a regulatory subunit of cAMP-dependent protein kinases [Alteribacillus persepolensis]|uniref:cAMP-binding domain of CRP or a regulatory subunit of cAMP-dependent protein kinases n=1 Tax=Alteribacillus persepolensis TaxID=568899 RepID=A0A1G8J7S5_9BACI|nr:Crp/Fnr family transcriptional regulator [Alteribacillus persepolensis]SDI27236.1 cAMP-binding domain of CRP or a regulatory subunit of cAMP-dependent protein kinases [Alteribacillus persepolensis]
MSMIFKREKNTYAPDWDYLLKHGNRQFVKKKSMLYKQGEIGGGFYYVHKGLFKMLSFPSDNKSRIVAVTGSENIIGEQALDRQPYFCSAVAIEDSVVYYFSNDVYRDLIKEAPSLLRFCADSILQKVQLLVNEIHLKSLTSEHQVAHSLLELSEAFNRLEVNMTQQELADYIGLTRITVYKILKKWKEEQLIDIKNRTFYIIKPEILRSYALSS